MLSQNDLERERYEARRKGQLDYNTGMKVARLEGRAEGRAEGVKIGQIQAFQRILNRPQTPTDQLAALPFDELSRLADSLLEQVSQK